MFRIPQNQAVSSPGSTQSPSARRRLESEAASSAAANGAAGGQGLEAVLMRHQSALEAAKANSGAAFEPVKKAPAPVVPGTPFSNLDRLRVCAAEAMLASKIQSITCSVACLLLEHHCALSPQVSSKVHSQRSKAVASRHTASPCAGASFYVVSLRLLICGTAAVLIARCLSATGLEELLTDTGRIQRKREEAAKKHAELFRPAPKKVAPEVAGAHAARHLPSLLPLAGRAGTSLEQANGTSALGPEATMHSCHGEGGDLI